MATTSVSSLGIGTGVDLQNMLTKIMAAERTPLNALDSKIASTNSKISLYGSLNVKLDALRVAADTLAFPSRLSAIKATSSDSTVVSANATFTAAVGTYATEVQQLAKAQKNVTGTYNAGTTFSAGEMKFTFAASGTEETINIAEGATLAEIASSINSRQIGVTASVLTTSSSGTQQLVLNGAKTGANNGFTTVATSTPSGGQAALDVFDQTTNAQDAKITIDGIEVTSNTNVFSNVLPGLTLNATKEGTSTVTVKNDSATITAAAQAFVDAFNGIATLVKENSSYNEATKTAGLFNGDSVGRTVMSFLGAARTTTPASLSDATFKSLSSIGIEIQQNGQLQLNSTKLEAAIAKSPSDVTDTLKAYGQQFNTTVQNMQSGTGVMSSRVDSLKSSLTRFTANRETLEARLQLVEKRYRAQFTALDKYVTSMQTTSGYLTQQLASLSSSSS